MVLETRERIRDLKFGDSLGLFGSRTIEISRYESLYILERPLRIRSKLDTHWMEWTIECRRDSCFRIDCTSHANQSAWLSQTLSGSIGSCFWAEWRGLIRGWDRDEAVGEPRVRAVLIKIERDLFIKVVLESSTLSSGASWRVLRFSRFPAHPYHDLGLSLAPDRNSLARHI